MSFSSDYEKLRKKKKKEEEKKTSQKKSSKDGSSFAEEYEALSSERATAQNNNNIAPLPSITPVAELLASPLAFRKSIQTAPTVPLQTSREERNKWFEKGAFEDGYQFGDVSKTVGATATDLILSVGEGVGNMAEGLVDLGAYGVAGVADLFGADRFAKSLKYKASKNAVSESVQELRDVSGIDDKSVLGQNPRGVGQGIGQILGIVATGGAGAAGGLGTVGTSILTTGVMGASSMGGGMSEAYQDGATDGQAVSYGAMKGVVDAGTELLSGGLGKAVKALGVSRGIGGLDDMFAKKLTSKISNQIASNAIQYGVKASGEGLEEVAAGALTAVAKNLTYKSDEELEQLIKDENLLDQFIIGTLTSMAAQSGDVITDTAKGRDFVTGLTENEQKVVDAEYNKRLAEEEKDGKKLDKKAKNKLYDEVKNDLEKGYISTDTIEEVLGGEDYSNYQRELKHQQDIDNELNELRNMKSGEMTDIQTERMAELKAMKPNTEMLNTLKFSIDENIRNGIKDTRLAESYNEQGRRRKAFEADLLQYDEKQRAVIQKAIDSKILNNTRRTHEFVDMIAKISADKGVSFDFTDNERLKKSGFAVEGATVNGFVTKDGITLNVQSKKAINKVVGHEITHVLEGTEHYSELQKAIFEYAKSKKDYQGRYDTLTKLYEGVEGADINAELTADLVGDYLFADEAFVSHLSTNNRNVFQKIYDEIKYLFKIATGKEARQLEKVKKIFDKVYKNNTKNTVIGDGVKYSLSNGETKKSTELSKEDLESMLENVQNGVFSDGSYIPLRRNTPEFFINVVAEHSNGAVNIEKYPMAATVEHLRQNMEDEDGKSYGNERPHGLSKDDIIIISEKMSDPSYIVLQENGRYAEVVSFYNGKNKKVVVVIDFADSRSTPPQNYKYAQYMNGYNEGFYNIVVTQYEPDSLERYLDKNEVVYDKKIMNGRYQVGSGRIVTVTHDTPFIDNSISQSDLNVNRKNSISKNGESQKYYSRYNVYGDDIRLQAPIREDIEQNATTTESGTVSKTEQVAPIRSADAYVPLAENISPLPEKSEAKESEERSWYETSTGSKAVDNMITPDDIPDDVRYYQVKSNKKTLETANARLARDGFAKSREYFEGRMADRKLTVEDIALGERLIQEAAKAGDAKAVRDLIIDVSIIGTELGQRVQALSMIRRLTPEGQLKALFRIVERGKAKGDKAFDGVEVTEDMAKRITDTINEDGTFDQAELDRAVDTVKQQIADKMSVSFADKVNAWRYLSMLGNSKTHKRNIFSNIAMFATRQVKNVMARTMEGMLLHNKKPTLNTEKPIAPIVSTRQIMPEGTKVRAKDRNNIGTIRSYNPQTGKYTVYFENKAAHNATVQLEANVLEQLNPIKQKSGGKANENADNAPYHYRTKTWRFATKAVKEFAKQTTSKERAAIQGDNKYSETGSIKAKRKIFKSKILHPVNLLMDANSKALEFEDWVFSKNAYRTSLQEYLTANGIKTEADIKNNPELVAKAKEYALDEAKKATFRQDSYLANKIGEIERKNPFYGVAIGAIMPFKKTPINVAKTGLAYSPLGFARNIYDGVKLIKGEMDASEAIDHLAQTLTGTSLAIIGYALAEAGILNGAGGDDKEDKYDYQLGEQSYSFNYGGDTYALSWLSPVAMPLFAGANAYEILVEQNEWDANIVIDTLGKTLDPMSEMSFLSSLDDVLSSYDNGAAKFFAAGGSMAQSYASQFIPTALSQTAATFDDTKRSTKASGDSGFEFGEETLKKIMYKIPGLRNTLEPTTDIWGNEAKQTENVLLRGFESFLSPANKRANISTAVDDELKALFKEVGKSEILPAIPYDYINYNDVKYDLSAKDYTEYKQNYGQTAYDLMEKLFDTDTYKNASSDEKADMVGRVYDYARDNAKKNYFVKFGVEYTNAESDGVKVYKEDPIKGAIEADLPIDEYVFKVDNPQKYNFFKSNGISYRTYAAADEEGKRAYNWAYDNPGKFTMSKVISDDFMEYYGYISKMNDFDAKDKNGESVSGLKKERVTDYINNLDLDYGQRIILYRSKYSSKADKNEYNSDIIDYLNSRDDVSYEEMVAILKELDMTVDDNGNIYWD